MRTIGLVFKNKKSVKNEKADEKEKSVKNEKADENSGLGDEDAKVQE